MEANVSLVELLLCFSFFIFSSFTGFVSLEMSSMEEALDLDSVFTISWTWRGLGTGSFEGSGVRYVFGGSGEACLFGIQGSKY